MTILSGLSLFLVLFVYKGFRIDTGVSFSGHPFWLRSLMFGLATSIFFWVMEFRLRKHMVPLSNIGQILFWLAEITGGATITYLLFNYFWAGTEWNLSAYLLLLGEYFSVMLIPILAVRLSDLQIEKPESRDDKFIRLVSDNGKHYLRVRASEILFLKAADNYVEVHFRSEGKDKKELIRNTLKGLLSQDTSGNLLRCHRSFAVNRENISKEIRRSRELILEVGEHEIPVSGKYHERFSH